MSGVAGDLGQPRGQRAGMVAARPDLLVLPAAIGARTIGIRRPVVEHPAALGQRAHPVIPGGAGDVQRRQRQRGRFSPAPRRAHGVDSVTQMRIEGRRQVPRLALVGQPEQRQLARRDPGVGQQQRTTAGQVGGRGQPQAPRHQLALDQRALRLGERGEVAEHHARRRHLGIGRDVLVAHPLGERTRIGAPERQQGLGQRRGGVEAGVAHVRQLHDPGDVVVADQDRDLRRRMGAQPAQHPRAVDAGVGDDALGAGAEVEVIPDADQLHVRPQAAVIAEQPVVLEHREDLVGPRLRISQRHRPGHRRRRRHRPSIAVGQPGGEPQRACDAIHLAILARGGIGRTLVLPQR